MGIFGTNGKGVVSVQGMFTQAALENLMVVLEEGALVSIGLTKDRGALSFSVWVNGVKDRDWFTDPELFAEALSAAAEYLTLGAAVPPSVKGPRKTSHKAP